MKIEDTYDEKVEAIFSELKAKRANQSGPCAREVIVQALADHYAVRRRRSKAGRMKLAEEIVFHLTDWSLEGRFIVAVLLFPERFTPGEIRTGISHFIIGASNHVAAAAELLGFPVVARRQHRPRKSAKKSARKTTRS